MRVFLHIGMPKSGTSSIQWTLRLKRKLLARHGVHFDYSNSLHDLAQGKDAALTDIPASCDTAIFSNERLFKGVNADGARRVLHKLQELSDDITLISYIRRQDEVFVSSYFTSIIGGATDRFEDRPLRPFPIYERLRIWESAFGRDRMSVVRFGPQYLPKGVVADFLERVGLAELELPEAPRFNVSPRADAIEAIRRINELVPDAERHPLKIIARSIGTGERLGMSARRRRELVELDADATARLSRRYFDGEPVFTHPFPDDAIEPVNLTTNEIAAIAKLIGERLGIEPGSFAEDTEEA